MKVICIAGKAQHGKDTTASIMSKQLTDKGYTVLIAHYSDLVKYVCKTFFNWNGEKDEYGRTLLQIVGTNKIRSKYHDFWVSFIAKILTAFENEWDYVLIPDTRFPNEINGLFYYGLETLSLRIERDNFDSGLSDEQKAHISETALDDFNFDFVIENNGSVEDLENKVNELLEVIKYAR